MRQRVVLATVGRVFSVVSAVVGTGVGQATEMVGRAGLCDGGAVLVPLDCAEVVEGAEVDWETVPTREAQIFEPWRWVPVPGMYFDIGPKT